MYTLMDPGNGESVRLASFTRSHRSSEHRSQLVAVCRQSNGLGGMRGRTWVHGGKIVYSSMNEEYALRRRDKSPGGT